MDFVAGAVGDSVAMPDVHAVPMPSENLFFWLSQRL